MELEGVGVDDSIAKKCEVTLKNEQRLLEKMEIVQSGREEQCGASALCCLPSLLLSCYSVTGLACYKCVFCILHCMRNIFAQKGNISKLNIIIF